MTTFNLEINNKPNKNGMYNVLVRITQNKKHKRIKTSVYLKTRSDFNGKAKNDNWIRKNEPFYAQYNSILVDEIIKAKNTYQVLKSGNQASLENIKSTIILSEVSGSFIEFIKQRTSEIYNQGNYRNSKKYNTFKSKIEEYLKTLNKSDLMFSEITTGFVTKFDTYLRTQKNSRKKDDSLLSNNYVVKIEDTFLALVNQYIKTYDIIDKLNPFHNFKIASLTPTHKIKLSHTEIEKIENLDLPIGSQIWHSRNCFLFSFYFAGIRIADVLQMRWKNLTDERRLRYQMDKAEKFKDFNIHDKALALVNLYKTSTAKPNDFVFPFLDSNADYAQPNTPQMRATISPGLKVKLLNTVNKKNSLVNKHLKEIGKMVGLNENLTSHIARHSFAKRAADMKISNNINKSLLGHANLKETEKYMGDFSTQETDEAMKTIFSYGDDLKAILISKINNMDSEKIKRTISLINEI